MFYLETMQNTGDFLVHPTDQFDRPFQGSYVSITGSITGWKVGCLRPPFFRAAYISNMEAAAGASEGEIPSEEVPCQPYDLTSHSP